MTAYSFKRGFVPPICLGLGIPVPAGFMLEPWHEPKTHTIRSRRVGRSRHARAGELVQLYCTQRDRDGFKIGVTPCAGAFPIKLDFERDRVEIMRGSEPFVTMGRALDKFARSDGFRDWDAMSEFWSMTHDTGNGPWVGVFIEWRGATP